MKTLACLVMTVLVSFSVGALAAGCAKQAPTPAQVGIAQKLCPVTGDPIDPAFSVDHKGRRIYFCCPSCPPEFNKDPEKYLKILDEQMKAAPTEAKPGAAEKKDAAPETAAAGYTCPMHPDVKSDKPGKCPTCGMALVPVKKAK